MKRDKVSLDIFWLKDESLEDSANLPDPDVMAAEIAKDPQAALDQFSQSADVRKRRFANRHITESRSLGFNEALE